MSKLLIILQGSALLGLCIFTAWNIGRLSKSGPVAIEFTTSDNIKVKLYDPPLQKEYSKVKASFVIGAYVATSNRYNCMNYDTVRTRKFLASLPDEYDEGEVIEVDGLKWIMSEGNWKPHRNPPGPFDSSGVQTNIHMYAEWINAHPHLGLPPLPILSLSQNKQIQIP